MLSYYVIYYEKFRKVMHQTKKEAFIKETQNMLTKLTSIYLLTNQLKCLQTVLPTHQHKCRITFPTIFITLIYYEKFRKVMQRTEKEALIVNVHWNRQVFCLN